MISFVFWHFPSIPAAVPGQAFLFFMVTPYQNLLSMARCYARYPLSLGWTVKLGQAVSFTLWLEGPTFW